MRHDGRAHLGPDVLGNRAQKAHVRQLFGYNHTVGEYTFENSI